MRCVETVDNPFFRSFQLYFGGKKNFFRPVSCGNISTIRQQLFNKRKRLSTVQYRLDVFHRFFRPFVRHEKGRNFIAGIDNGGVISSPENVADADKG